MITALVLASGVTAAVLFSPSWAVGGIMGIIWLGGVWEWAGLARLQGPARAGYLGAFAALMFVLAYWGFDRDWAIPVTGVAVAWWGLALLGLRAYPRRIPLAAVGAAGPLALLPAWFLLTHLHGNAAQGPGLTLSVLLIVWAADVGAYLVGSRWGQVKLAPRVSPGKTWEGFTGGMLLAARTPLVASLTPKLPRGP
ncbi:MAG: phosphatidate cytidylyltransferase, partial [Rhodospirillaceae bacterium]|nr:phosphatidate cytidylyltransferase [Rhodospirillaceae bacterium]